MSDQKFNLNDAKAIGAILDRQGTQDLNSARAVIALQGRFMEFALKHLTPKASEAAAGPKPSGGKKSRK